MTIFGGGRLRSGTQGYTLPTRVDIEPETWFSIVVLLGNNRKFQQTRKVFFPMST